MTKYKLAVDTGSTFTDLCLLPDDGSQVMIAKVRLVQTGSGTNPQD
jgi:N-methylhydantoinase A/oxoprolinase/acetone carboxylase beta subunit